jgi:acetoin utilization protein AcuB
MCSVVDHIPVMASVMTPFPHYVEPDDSLRRAHELMVQHEVRHLPVLNGHELVGIVTDRDIKRALDPDLGLPSKDELFVRDVYVSQPYVVDSATPLDGVLEQMVARRVGSALVTKHGRLAGIFTAMDACRLYCEHLRKLFPPRSGDEVA